MLHARALQLIELELLHLAVVIEPVYYQLMIVSDVPLVVLQVADPSRTLGTQENDIPVFVDLGRSIPFGPILELEILLFLEQAERLVA